MALSTKSRRKRAELTAIEVARLQVETALAQSTIRMWGQGEAVRPSTHRALSKAALKLGIPVLV